MCEVEREKIADGHSDIAYVAGQPYIREWRRARRAARETAIALEEAGFDASELRVAPGSGANGEALVVVRGRLDAVRCLVCLIGQKVVGARADGSSITCDVRESEGNGS